MFSVLLYLFSLGIPHFSHYPLIMLGIAGLFSVAGKDISGKGIAGLINWALIAFVVVTLLSCIFSIDVGQSISVSLSLISCAVLFYCILCHFDKSRLHYLFIVLTSVNLMIALYLTAIVLRQPGASPAQWRTIAAFPLLSVPNDLLFLAATAPMALVLFFPTFYPPVKAMAGVSLLLSLMLIVLFQSKAGLLVYFLSLMCCLALVKPKYFWRGGLMLMVCIVLVDGANGFLLFKKATNAALWTIRIPLWMAAWQMFLDAPVIGQGPGAFMVLSDRYMEEISSPSWVLRDRRHMSWAHSLYLECLAERGCVGLAAVTALFGVLGTALWRLYISGGTEKKVFFTQLDY